MNALQKSSITNKTSIFDGAGLDALRKRLRIDPGVLRRLRIDFFKNRLDADDCLSRMPSNLKETFGRELSFNALKIKERFDSQFDGATKLIFETPAGFVIESVILRAATGRVALCLSSQVGCAAACDFCATGKMGVARDLSAAEIVDQLAHANRLLRSEDRQVRNLVFMGMGEPLHNMEQVHAAIELFTSPLFFNHPPNRILVSTVGITDKLIALANQLPSVNYAISLHSVNQAERESIIPIAKRYSLDSLRNAIVELNQIQSERTSVMIEYLMLDSLNDSPNDAALLMRWVSGLRVHVNLIPYNHVEEAPHLNPSPRTKIEAFGNRLKQAGVPTTIRYSMGRDIDAACGQLVKRENQAIAKELSIQCAL